MAALGVVSVVDAVTADLRERILSGDLTPGEPMGEVDTAAHYAVARPTARAAIETLVAAGLLTRGAHKSARVAHLSATDVSDIYRTRARVEGDVVRQLAAARMSVPAATDANDRIRFAPNAPVLQIVDLDMQFHTALIDAVASERTSRIYRLLADEVRLCMVQAQRADLLAVGDIVAEHADLLTHIASGDADAATSLLDEHLARARERLMRHLSAQV